MFGAYYYGFCDRSDLEGYMKISYLANGMDKNDFLFSNSSYSLTYVRSIPRGPIVVHSTSTPSLPATWDSPVQPPRFKECIREGMGPQTSTDPGIAGLDEYGTTTFQVHAWMAAPTEQSDGDEARTHDLAPVVQNSDTEGHRDEFVVDTNHQASWILVAESERGNDSFQSPPREQALENAEGADNTLVEEVSHPPAPQRTPVIVKEVIDLSDDDPLDHPHSSDDDDNPGRTVAPYEKKPTILPSRKVKVEGDWWTYEAEKRDRRIACDKARQEEREAKEQEVAVANAKLAQVQAESEKKISSLQSQMDELRNMLLS